MNEGRHPGDTHHRRHHGELKRDVESTLYDPGRLRRPCEIHNENEKSRYHDDDTRLDDSEEGPEVELESTIGLYAVDVFSLCEPGEASGGPDADDDESRADEVDEGAEEKLDDVCGEMDVPGVCLLRVVDARSDLDELQEYLTSLGEQGFRYRIDEDSQRTGTTDTL